MLLIVIPNEYPASFERLGPNTILNNLSNFVSSDVQPKSFITGSKNAIIQFQVPLPCSF